MTDTLDAPVFEESVLPICSTPRSAAIAAGDLSRATLREVDRVLALHPKDTLASLEVAVARLVSDGAIPRCDAPRLEAILRTVVRGDTDGSVEPASAVIRRIYDELIMDPAAGTITI